MARRTLVLAALSLCAAATLALRASADEGGPLDRAERIERQARELLEQGRRVQGAKMMVEAWTLRAKAWSAQEKEGELSRTLREDPLLILARGRVEGLKAASEAEEKAGHAARKAGNEDGARRHMEESGRLWKKAEALEAYLGGGFRPAGDAKTSREALLAETARIADGLARLRQTLDEIRARLAADAR